MKRLLIAATALSLIGGSVALAADRGAPNRHDNRSAGRGDRDHDGIPNRFDNRDNRFSYGGRSYNRFRGPSYRYPRGLNYRAWSRGQVLPRAYFANPYYIDNYSTYGLRPPPRGYRYVRVGNDVVLAAIAGGLIAEVIGNVFY